MKRQLATVVLWSIIICLGLGGTPVWGASYYVNPEGSNTNSGTSADSPWQTIGYALDQAVSGDTLILSAGTFNEHGLTLTRDIHIVGQGPDATIIDGQYLNRVLSVAAMATVTIEKVTIRNGQSPTIGLDAQPGGGIYNAGAITLIQCRIADNRAGHGGQYQATPGPGGHGGGIYAAGTSLTMIDCDVTGNAAGNGGQAMSGNNGGDGGGIFVAAGVALILSNSRVEGNAAGEGTAGGSGSGSGGSGGGIRNLGTVTATNCVISGNRAGNGGGNAASTSPGGLGGGIYNGGTLTMTTSRIEGNAAGNGGSGVDGEMGGNGGGIWNNGTCTLSQTRIAGNFAGNGAYGILTNGNGGSAGGMFSSGSTTLTACQITGNRVGVPGTNTEKPAAAPGYGGGLYLSNTIATLTNSTIGVNDGGRTGGVFAAGSSCHVTIRHSTIYGNRAETTVGGIGLSGGVVVTVSNSIVASNTAGSDFVDISRIDGAGTITSGGYNLVQSPGAFAGVLTAAGDLTNQNPGLALLGDYGGPTLSFIPLPNSPVIDCIPVNNSNLTSTDQRGYTRPIGSGGDIGAVEVWPSSVTTATPTGIQGNSANGGGEVLSAGVTVSARGVCWNNSGAPTVTDAHTEDGAGNGAFTSQITGLSPGTTYHVRAYLVCDFGTFYGNEITFTTDALPVVNTDTVDRVTGFTAVVKGTVANDGGDAAVIRGICWNTSPGPTVDNNVSSAGTGTGEFICSLTGLTSGTLYYVRAFAANNVGTVYGNEVTFTTDTLPTVATGEVTHISAVSANCKGEVTADGGEPVTARGLCWGTSPNPTTADFTNDPGQGTGLFAAAMAPLQPATTYYVRAYALNSVGTAYGESKSFTTSAALPNVLTLLVTSIAATEAQSGGAITNDGGDPVLDRGVCWSTSDDPTILDAATNDGTGTGEFLSTLTNLKPETIYYVRAYARNSVGTRYGPVLAFTTAKASSPQPIITGTPTPTPEPTITATPTPETTITATPTPGPATGTNQEPNWLTVNIPLPYWCVWPFGIVLATLAAGFLGLSGHRE